MKRGRKQAQGQVGAIETAILQNPVIHCDETGSRVENNNWWEYRYRGVACFAFQPQLGCDPDVMGDAQAEVWVLSGVEIPGAAAPTVHGSNCAICCGRGAFEMAPSDAVFVPL